MGAWFQVLFHSPHRGSFHLSLTVLVRYRSTGVFSLGRWSALLPTAISRAPWYSGLTSKRLLAFVYGTLTLCGSPSQALPLALSFVTLRYLHRDTLCPPLPHSRIGGGLCRVCGLGCSPFARRYSGNTLCSSGYLDVSVPPLASPLLVYWFPSGLPHSGIRGLYRLLGASPRLIAAMLRPSSAPDA